MTNLQLCSNLIQSLLDLGVQEFCLCAGARNSPLIILFEQNPDLKTYSFFEERSAAFFALGRMAQTKRPVAVITTSGTAVAELLPATIEAYYSGLALILISADRPKSYRGSGAPQSIEQVGIFSHYVERSWDLDDKETEIDFHNLSWKKPLHINLCLKEPLIDSAIPKLTDRKIDFQNSNPLNELNRKLRASGSVNQNENLNQTERLQSFISKAHPLVILGALTENEIEFVLPFLKRIKAPVYAEAISCLRGHAEISDFEIRSGEKMLQKLFADQVVDSVLRIGGVPTVRLWRDLEDSKRDLPVLNLSSTNFSGLSRNSESLNDFSILNSVSVAGHFDLTWKAFDNDQKQKLDQLFLEYPFSEPAIFRQLSMGVGGQSVYLGNSLPIREWDLCADFSQVPSRCFGNRGANGIDGQVSTFLGWADSGHNWCVIGDLTALYDLSALWIVKQGFCNSKFRLVVINNSGGQIFKRMFAKEIFLNRHGIEFSNWAKMFDLEYAVVKSGDFSGLKLSQQAIIEVQPEEGQTTEFWKKWEQSWQK